MRKGAAWELQNELWAKEYQRLGQAFIVKCHPGSKVIEGRLIYDSTGPPDYLGCLSSGRAVAFEAKEIIGSRFPFKNLELHQARALSRFHRMGGLAFVAVQSMVGVRVAARVILPWTTIGPLYENWLTGSKPASIELVAGIPMDAQGWLGPLTG